MSLWSSDAGRGEVSTGKSARGSAKQYLLARGAVANVSVPDSSGFAEGLAERDCRALPRLDVLGVRMSINSSTLPSEEH